MQIVRTNFSDIAEELDISVTAVVKRFKKMKKMGIVVQLLLSFCQKIKMFALTIRAYAELMLKSFIDFSEKINMIKKHQNIQKLFLPYPLMRTLPPPKFELLK